MNSSLKILSVVAITVFSSNVTLPSKKIPAYRRPFLALQRAHALTALTGTDIVTAAGKVERAKYEMAHVVGPTSEYYIANDKGVIPQLNEAIGGIGNMLYAKNGWTQCSNFDPNRSDDSVTSTHVPGLEVDSVKFEYSAGDKTIPTTQSIQSGMYQFKMVVSEVEGAAETKVLELQTTCSGTKTSMYIRGAATDLDFQVYYESDSSNNKISVDMYLSANISYAGYSTVRKEFLRFLTPDGDKARIYNVVANTNSVFESALHGIILGDLNQETPNNGKTLLYYDTVSSYQPTYNDVQAFGGSSGASYCVDVAANAEASGCTIGLSTSSIDTASELGGDKKLSLANVRDMSMLAL